MTLVYHTAGLHDPKFSRLGIDQLAGQLKHFTTPGVVPSAARINPKLKAQTRRPMKIWDVWKYGTFVLSKATEITGDVLSHHMWGPRKKSWGIEMTIISSIMRNAGRHSYLVDIATIRTLMGIGGLVPLPSDALATPFSFLVQKRHLRGILSKFDENETGRRQLTGEWIVAKKTWQRLQSEWKKCKDQKCAHPEQLLESGVRTKENVIMYVHGGAYYLSSAAAQRLISIPLAKSTDAPVFAIDYRLAPETRFPGPLHDVVNGYIRLIEDLRVPPQNIVLSGDSAGGGLCLALMMYLRDNGYPMPGGAILLSPWVDLSLSCESWETNSGYDVVPFPAQDSHLHPVLLYLGEDIEEYLTHPYASPLFGDLSGLPPMLIQVGDAEVLRDEITLLAHKATSAGVNVHCEIFEDAIHVFQSYPFLRATRQAFLSIENFVRRILPQACGVSPEPLNFEAESNLERDIKTDKAIVVSGDGARAGTGMDAVYKELGGETCEDGDDIMTEDLRNRPHPSWKRSSQIWSLVTFSSTLPEEHDIDLHHLNRRNRNPATPPTTPTNGGPENDAQLNTTNRSRLKRIHSAVFMERSYTSTPPAAELSDAAGLAQHLPPRPSYLHRPPFAMSHLYSSPTSPSLLRSKSSHYHGLASCDTVHLRMDR